MHVLVVGSSVVDLFLDIDKDFFQIQDGNVTFKLGDKIPSEIKQLALGGNGANVSVGLTRLEIPTTFYTYLGGDILSREIEEGLTREGVELKAERNTQKSSSLSIIFGFETDRTIFSHHEVRDYEFTFDDSSHFDYIFLTSIGERWEKAYDQIWEYASRNNIPIAFSPGVRQLENINETVKTIIKNSKIFLCNKEEAIKIIASTSEVIEDLSDIKKILLSIKQLGPQIVSITDGGSGAYAMNRENAYYIKPAPYEGKDKTGAGDAYATGFVAATIMGEDIPTSMLWGTINSGSVIQQLGAQLGLLKKGALTEQVNSANIKADTL